MHQAREPRDAESHLQPLVTCPEWAALIGHSVLNLLQNADAIPSIFTFSVGSSLVSKKIIKDCRYVLTWFLSKLL